MLPSMYVQSVMTNRIALNSYLVQHTGPKKVQHTTLSLTMFYHITLLLYNIIQTLDMSTVTDHVHTYKHTCNNQLYNIRQYIMYKCTHWIIHLANGSVATTILYSWLFSRL